MGYDALAVLVPVACLKFYFPVQSLHDRTGPSFVSDKEVGDFS